MKLEDKSLDICLHDDVSFEPACCKNSHGIIECACLGKDEVVCMNPDCQGISEDEVEAVFDRFIGGGSDCE